MTRFESQRGFTLIEMAMAIIGTLAVTAIVVITLTTSSRFATGAVQQSSGQTALRTALDAMGSEMQWASQATIIISQLNGSSKMDFKVPTAVVNGAATLSTTITYQVDPSTMDANGNHVHDDGMLVRIQNGVKTVVCQRIKTGGVVLTRNGDHLTVSVTVMMPNGRGGEMDYVGSTTIQLKNT